jgi:hypothetical protein
VYYAVSADSQVTKLKNGDGYGIENHMSFSFSSGWESDVGGFEIRLVKVVDYAVSTSCQRNQGGGRARIACFFFAGGWEDGNLDGGSIWRMGNLD